MFATSSGGQACAFMGCIFAQAMQNITVCFCTACLSTLRGGIDFYVILAMHFIFLTSFSGNYFDFISLNIEKLKS